MSKSITLISRIYDSIPCYVKKLKDNQFLIRIITRNTKTIKYAKNIPKAIYADREEIGKSKEVYTLLEVITNSYDKIDPLFVKFLIEFYGFRENIV